MVRWILHCIIMTVRVSMHCILTHPPFCAKCRQANFTSVNSTNSLISQNSVQNASGNPSLYALHPLLSSSLQV